MIDGAIDGPLADLREGVIYMASFPNGKAYVGQTVNFEKRKAQHIASARTGKGATLFHRAIVKHGAGSIVWEVLERHWTRAELDEAERRLIAEHGTLKPGGYNLSPGGDEDAAAGRAFARGYDEFDRDFCEQSNLERKARYCKAALKAAATKTPEQRKAARKKQRETMGVAGRRAAAAKAKSTLGVEGRSAVRKKQIKTMGAEGMRTMRLKGLNTLGLEGMRAAKKKRDATLGLEGMKAARKKQSETMGVEGRQAASLKAKETMGAERRRVAMLKANATIRAERTPEELTEFYARRRTAIIKGHARNKALRAQDAREADLDEALAMPDRLADLAERLARFAPAPLAGAITCPATSAAPPTSTPPTTSYSESATS